MLAVHLPAAARRRHAGKRGTPDCVPNALIIRHRRIRRLGRKLGHIPHRYTPVLLRCAAVDADVPRWKDDQWYWSKEATDWGWDWAPEEQKHLHPKYVPVYRYARDMIGCLNNWVDGWVDWNMVLNRQGGPNWFENWCVAPVIVDPKTDEVYYTPLYYIMAHFSKYIRPGAEVISAESSDTDLMVAAAKNPDGSTAVVIFNEGMEPKFFELKTAITTKQILISPQAIQTIVITN